MPGYPVIHLGLLERVAYAWITQCDQNPRSTHLSDQDTHTHGFNGPPYIAIPELDLGTNGYPDAYSNHDQRAGLANYPRSTHYHPAAG